MTNSVTFLSNERPLPYSVPDLLRKLPVSCVVLARYNVGNTTRDRYIVNPWRDPSWGPRTDGLLVLAFRQYQMLMLNSSGNDVGILTRSRSALELMKAMDPGDSITHLFADNWRHSHWFGVHRRNATHFFGVPL
jgi:hypothetical protein